MTRARDVSTPTALVLISSTTIGTAVSSVTVSNAFSATYDNYRVLISGGVGSSGNNIGLKLGAAATNYNHAYIGVVNNSTVTLGWVASDTSWPYAGNFTTNYIDFSVDLINPFLTKYTLMEGVQRTTTSFNTLWCNHLTAASYTDFTITPAGGTLTGGTIKVYGYK